MPSGLTGMEIQILYILYRNKNFKTDAGYHGEKHRKILRKKYDQDFDEAISHLKNLAYIAAIRKKELKYYIIDLSKTSSVLEAHDLNVTPLGGQGYLSCDFSF
jgi:hypothetical protein